MNTVTKRLCCHTANVRKQYMAFEQHKAVAIVVLMGKAQHGERHTAQQSLCILTATDNEDRPQNLAPQSDHVLHQEDFANKDGSEAQSGG